MVDKNSQNYLKSEFKRSFYGDDHSTTYEKSLKIAGKDKNHLDEAAPWIKAGVM